jgi:hypothetical protein
MMVVDKEFERDIVIDGKELAKDYKGDSSDNIDLHIAINDGTIPNVDGTNKRKNSDAEDVAIIDLEYLKSKMKKTSTDIHILHTLTEETGVCELCNYINYSDGDYIDLYILKSMMMEEFYCCPVYKGTCQCLYEKSDTEMYTKNK